MIYIVAMRDAKVLAYDGKHYAVIHRIFGSVKDKMAAAILAAYLKVFRETDELPISGFKDYYVVTIKNTPLIRAVAKTCLDSRDKSKDRDTTIDHFAREISFYIVILAYTQNYQEVPALIDQVKLREQLETISDPEEDKKLEIPF